MQPQVRTSWTTLFAVACALTAGACKSDVKALGIVPAEERMAPLTPGNRAHVNGQGQNCTANSSGPSVCTTASPSCTLTFDANDDLTHLLCEVSGGYHFECTRPCPGVYECTWSDRPDCADLYDATGNFITWACPAATDPHLTCAHPDGGSGPDGGSRCHGLDEQACTADPACTVHHCPGCNGTTNYAGCGDPNEPTVCPAITCPTCRGLDEMTCSHTPGCEPISCGCNPPSYVGCFGPGDPRPSCPTCVACQGLDEHACMADPACSPGYCPTCGGGMTYSGCFQMGQPHDCAPPPPNCHTCSGLSETACLADASCRADYCPSCQGRSFVACADPNTPPPPCPAITCPSCMGFDEQTCSANPDCHPVYSDSNVCGCAPAGCCIRFNHCGQGGHAQCSPSPGPMCAIAEPVCTNGFVVAYTSGCYEGCVHPQECGGQPALCGQGGTWPAFPNNCMSDQDCYLGIHQTDCCGSQSAIGVASSSQMSFQHDEAICDAEWPACGCPTRGITADDGMTTIDPTHVHVRCDTSTGLTGQCRTYVQ